MVGVTTWRNPADNKRHELKTYVAVEMDERMQFQSFVHLGKLQRQAFFLLQGQCVQQAAHAGFARAVKGAVLHESCEFPFSLPKHRH